MASYEELTSSRSELVQVLVGLRPWERYLLVPYFQRMRAMFRERTFDFTHRGFIGYVA